MKAMTASEKTARDSEKTARDKVKSELSSCLRVRNHSRSASSAIAGAAEIQCAWRQRQGRSQLLPTQAAMDSAASHIGRTHKRRRTVSTAVQRRWLRALRAPVGWDRTPAT